MPNIAKKVILVVGIACSLVGVFLAAKVLFFSQAHEGHWRVQVEGNSSLSSDEISSVVLHLLRSNREGLSTDDIAEALQMNPRIASITVSAHQDNLIVVNLTERETAYLKNTNSGITEVAQDGTTLQEQVERANKPVHPTMPIFYLTHEVDGTQMTDKIRSDIIRLYQETVSDYAFLWDRIGEIELTRGETTEGQMILYPVQVRSKILVKIPVTSEMLSRLWAVFFYLEKNAPQTLTRVEINERNAIVKEILPES